MFLVSFLCVCFCFSGLLQAVSLVLDEARVEIARLMAQLSLSDRKKPFPFKSFPLHSLLFRSVPFPFESYSILPFLVLCLTGR